MVEVVTKFDESAQKAMSRLFLKPRLIFLGVFMAILISAGIIIVVLGDWIIGAVFIILGIFAVPSGVFLGMLLRRSAIKKNKFLNAGITNHFTFDGNFLYSKTTNFLDINDVGGVSAHFLLKAIETKEHFFVYPNQSSAYVLPKKDITQGTADELRMILQTWFGPKFKMRGRF